MKRRSFLRLMGAGAAAGLTSFARPPRALALPPWGDYPSRLSSAALPIASRASQVFEVHIEGGLSPWESFYAVDDEGYGKADRLGWWTFQDAPISVPQVAQDCLGLTGPLLQDFARDANGVMVKLGPFADAFRKRPDILARLRIVVMTHDVFPHFPATALATTGVRVGQPRLASVGAAVQHYAQSHTTSLNPRPSAFVVSEGFDGPVVAVGTHPQSCRPFSVGGMADVLFGDSLGALADKVATGRDQALLQAYTDQWHRRLIPSGGHSRLRSPVTDDFESSIRLRAQAQALQGLVQARPELSAPFEQCGDSYPVDPSRMRYAMAARLLNESTTRHVTVVERGYETGLDVLAFDSHFNYMADHAPKLIYSLGRLADSIALPGESDPDKIDLNETMVVVNTEFGRAPGIQTNNSDEPGRNHHPAAYVSLMFGGPIGPEQRGIVGAIGPTGQPVGALAPAETRAASLVALGIWPFGPSGYSSSDIPGASSEEEAVWLLRNRVLGVA